jgi:squalene synthase HpnD
MIVRIEAGEPMDESQLRGIPATTVDREQVEDLVRKAGTSFYWAMRWLPSDKRAAMFAVYAFCRVVDDIADDPGEEAGKRQELNDWRHEIHRAYGGEPYRAITRALLAPIHRYDLRRRDFLDVIDGVEMDAADRVRITDLDQLHLYCDRVACAVGRLSVRIFGLPESLGDPLAGALGEALQLTNILRDIKEDADRDRLYLPADLLAGQGVTGAESAEMVVRHQDVAAVCKRLAALAEQRFAEARAIADRCDRRLVRPARIMMEVYRLTFERLNDRGWQRWAEPVRVSSAEKLWVALRHGAV